MNELVIKKEKARIGVFGVGYDVYWGQFDGLLNELMAKHAVFKEKLIDKNVDIIDFGMIDNPKKAYEKLKEIQASNLDLIFCNMLFNILIKCN